MIVEKLQKNPKFKFEDINADYIWEINPENQHLLNDEGYGNLLTQIYFYDPELHEFDEERFKINF